VYKKILVCLDGSKLAEQILPYAIEQAVHFNSKVVLFQAVTPPVAVAPGVPGVAGPPIETEGTERDSRIAETEAEIYLEEIVQRLKKKKLKVASVVWVGVPGESAIAYADSNKVDLIAIATHGRSGLRRVVFGSVAEYILRNSTLPILMIRPR